MRCDAAPTRSSRATPTRASSASRSSRTGSRSARSSPGRCRESGPWPRSRSPSPPTARGCSIACGQARVARATRWTALLAADEQARFRQVAVVDAKGGVAVHTGDGCIPHAGDAEGDGFSVQANMMASAGVWPAMAEAFGAADGPLARQAAGGARGRRGGGRRRARAPVRGAAGGAGRPARSGRRWPTCGSRTIPSRSSSSGGCSTCATPTRWRPRATTWSARDATPRPPSVTGARPSWSRTATSCCFGPASGSPREATSTRARATCAARSSCTLDGGSCWRASTRDRARGRARA